MSDENEREALRAVLESERANGRTTPLATGPKRKDLLIIVFTGLILGLAVSAYLRDPCVHQRAYWFLFGGADRWCAFDLECGVIEPGGSPQVYVGPDRGRCHVLTF